MSKTLYRSLVLGCALAWMQVGSVMTRLLRGIDAGASPGLPDVLSLAGLTITGLLAVIALLSVQVADPRHHSPPASRT